MTTVLIIFLLNLSNPQQATMLTKAFNSPSACELAKANMIAEAPQASTVAIHYNCVTLAQLEATN